MKQFDNHTRPRSFLVLLSTVCLSMACDPGDEPQPVEEFPSQTCTMITASQGGTIGGAQQRIEVDVPPGTLAEDTELCIEYVEPMVDRDTIIHDTGFKLTPETVELQKPVRFSVFMSDEEFDAGVLEANLRIHILRDGEWQVDENATMNTAWSLASSESDELGTRVVRPMDNPEPQPDAGMDTDTGTDADASDTSDTSDASDTADTVGWTDGCECVGDECEAEVRPTAVARARIQGDSTYSDNLTVEPPQTVEFSAADSSAPDASAGDLAFEWVVVSHPVAASAMLLPGNTNVEPRMLVDRIGTYVVELRVTRATESGTACAEPARVEIASKPSSDVYAELTTRTPSDPDPTDDEGVAVTLHYLHPQGLWGSDIWDCHWSNPNPDWGAQGDTADDPKMVPGEIGSQAPARVMHSGLESLIYQFGFYYLSASVGETGDVTSYVTMRIYLEGELAAEFQDVELDREEQFFRAGYVESPSMTFEATEALYQGFPNN
ncbi:MAG: hypothetical protein ACQEVA_04220 [Myxococcota bacterium]